MRFYYGSRRRRLSLHSVLVSCALLTCVGFFLLTLRSIDPPSNDAAFLPKLVEDDGDAGDSSSGSRIDVLQEETKLASNSCATVEQMGESFKGGDSDVNLRVRRIIHRHFDVYGASRVRDLPPDQFCEHGFVLAKASEAGFGNEMYRILNAAALSIMLNRSLIIGQTRGKYPFGDFISYSNQSFAMNEIKHLWRKNGCIKKYGRHLVMRIDDFENPGKSNVLCSNWKKWEQPIIWSQNTTNAVASQFFLKNVNPEMRDAASELFGQPDVPESRPNVFGELMKFLISPSKDIMEAVDKVLDGTDPDISLHTRMLMNRSVRAMQAAINCIQKAISNLNQMSTPRVVLVSDTPSFVQSLRSSISDFAEVLYFDYGNFQGNVSQSSNTLSNLGFRAKDWGPAPRWVAFVDFFLASRAKHAVVSGAHRRVGTTYAQLVAALAAANHLEENSSNGSDFAFLSSFQSNLVADGLRLQIGWGHVWNRFAGPLSCRHQPNQCALTPLLPPAWWDGLWQSPIPRDIRKMAAYGIKLSGFGTVDEDHLRSVCNSRKSTVKTVSVL